MNVIWKRLRIGGMSCINCENKIESKLKNTAGICDARVSYHNGMADISYDPEQIDEKQIQKLIEKLGYRVLQEGEIQKKNVQRTIFFVAVIIFLYTALEQFGILNFLVPSQLADSKMGYGMLFLVGVLTSVHCIAMCGGIHLSQCISHGSDGEENGQKQAVFQSAFLYNLGRVVSYTAVGFLLGLLGMLVGAQRTFGFSVFLQGGLKIAVGIAMIIMGINLLGIFPWLKRFQIRLPKRISIKVHQKKASTNQPFLVGLLNGLMPCGPLQSIQMVAFASGNPISGMLSMLFFGLGTVPLMLGFGSLISILSKKFSQKMMDAGAVLVTVLGLAMLSQGGSLSGLFFSNQLLLLMVLLGFFGAAASIVQRKIWYAIIRTAIVIFAVIGISSVFGGWNQPIPLAETAAKEEKPELTDGVQVVQSTLSPGRYPSITVQAGIPVQWVIEVPPGAVNGCNYKMLLREYGIEHTFTEGKNVIEFTPQKTGRVQYSCWMGMIRGSILVTDKNGEEADLTQDTSGEPQDFDSLYGNFGMGCCGGI